MHDHETTRLLDHRGYAYRGPSILAHHEESATRREAVNDKEETSMTEKSAAYWEGRAAEDARIAARDRARAALDAHPNVVDLAKEVAKHLGRDQGRKQHILQRSPHIFSAMDADEVGQASARELAVRELKDLGIDCGDNDPVALLDAHHAGRDYGRGGQRTAGGMDSAGPSWVDKLINDHS